MLNAGEMGRGGGAFEESVRQAWMCQNCVSIKYAFVPCILEEKDMKYGHVHSFFPSFITTG